MTEEEAIAKVASLLHEHNKGRLSYIQQRVFAGCWKGLSYKEIAGKYDYQTEYVKQVGYQLWRSLSAILGETVNKNNIESVLVNLGELPVKVVDWGEAIDVSRFYGRESELKTLNNWVTESKCRLVGVFGLGGMGKTALSVKLAQQARSHFDYLIWRTLRQAPSLTELLKEIVPIIIGSEAAEDAGIESLMAQLRQKRCLIVLDNIESILQPSDRAGVYRAGYEDYKELLERIAEESHTSCLLITGREKPGGLAVREGTNLPTRTLSLSGVSPSTSEKILKDKGLKATEGQNHTLTDYFGGNPLALKIASTTILTLFGGNVQAFLNQGNAVFGNLWDLLEQQFARLSDLQRSLMHWLAIDREAVSLEKLQAEIYPKVTIKQLMEAVETLQERSLIETGEVGITQQPVIMEYVTEKLVDAIAREIIENKLDLFNYLALLEAKNPDYLRDAQTQLILQPICDRLTVYFPKQSQLEAHLHEILVDLQSRQESGYAGGNLLNLFVHLKIDLTGLDFSGLTIRQAYLANTTLQQTDFTGVYFEQTAFAETFGGVLCVVYSPDGELLASSDSKGEIQAWNSRTFAPIFRLRGHQHWAWAIAFSPDGKYLASGAADCAVKLWDVKTGECLQTYTKHTYAVNAIAFHPDGKIFASAGEDLTIRIWGTYHHQDLEIQLLSGHQKRIWSLAFSPVGKTLASCGEEGTIRIWDLETGNCTKSWQAHSAWARYLTFSPDGNILATGSYDKTIKIWDVETQKCLATLTGHQSTVTGLAFHPLNPSLLASASFDRTVKLWNLETETCEKTLLGHTNRVWCVAFHPQAEEIATGGDDRATKVWDLASGRCSKTIKGHSNAVLSLALSPDGEYLASGHEDQTVRIWSMSGGEMVRTLREHTNRVWSIAFSPTGSLLASGSADYSIKLWDWQAENCVMTLLGHQSWVWRVDFSPDGTKLASGSYDRVLKIWDVATGECKQTLTKHSHQMAGVAFSADGNYLASCDFGGAIALEDLQNPDRSIFLEGHTNTVWSVTFSADSRYLLSASSDRTVKLWSVTTGECLQTFTGHEEMVATAKFMSDRLIISGGGDGKIEIWNIETGKCLQTIASHTNVVYSLLVLPNNKAISGSFDETIKFWDLSTGKCERTLRVPNPYEGMKISGVKGLNETQLATLLALGAIN